MTRSGEPKFLDSHFSQDGLVRTALQGPCTPEGCCVSRSLGASGGVRARGGRQAWRVEWQRPTLQLLSHGGACGGYMSPAGLLLTLDPLQAVGFWVAYDSTPDESDFFGRFDQSQ